MKKVLLISDDEKSIKYFDELFVRNSYEFHSSVNEIYICDLTAVDAPDVVVLDDKVGVVDLKRIVKKIKSYTENCVMLLLSNSENIDKDLLKQVNAIVTNDMSEEVICSIIKINLRMKNSLDMLSNTNKDLADSLYRLNALYSTSSNFAGTLDKSKLLNYMIEGMDKALSFSLTCTLSLCSEEQPVLILNSLHDISDELLVALKFRTVLNYNALFENLSLPYKIDIDGLKVVKHIKYPANKFTFTLFQYDNMLAPISLGDDCLGFVEIYKDTPFSSEDSTCFQTIAQQVSLPLKSATLYQEIKETNLKLERLEHVKSEFISIVSHELRTPLTSIKNSLDIMLSGRCGEISSSADKFLSMARRNVQRLSEIINDLLDISKIEAGKMDFNFKEININSVIEYAKSTFSEIAKSKNINLIVQEMPNSPMINADLKRLEQVLTNLVSNAIKFTYEGKNVVISSHLINAKDIKINPIFADGINLDGDYIQVSVIDEGIGIEQKDLLQVFEKFAQIENSLSRKEGGSGLGLPIAKQLLDAHGGAIWCESEPEKGSNFSFVLPVVAKPCLVV
ncbi:MAG: HAMP domain-containing sensor histidine kinase [Candidatus Gastranaerophilales bacterium]